jgi:hypothetical protein
MMQNEMSTEHGDRFMVARGRSLWDRLSSRSLPGRSGIDRLESGSHRLRRFRHGRIGLLSPLFAAILLAPGCNKPAPARPAVATSAPTTTPAPPAPHAAETPPPIPTTAPAVPATSEPATVLSDTADQLPAESWLRIEQLRSGAGGGWISGHCPAADRIELETENITQFSLDVSQLQLDWSGRVWMRIDQNAFELLHKRNPVVHLRQISTGAWEVVKASDD